MLAEYDDPALFTANPVMPPDALMVVTEMRPPDDPTVRISPTAYPVPAAVIDPPEVIVVTLAAVVNVAPYPVVTIETLEFNVLRVSN